MVTRLVIGRMHLVDQGGCLGETCQFTRRLGVVVQNKIIAELDPRLDDQSDEALPGRAQSFA